MQSIDALFTRRQNAEQHFTDKKPLRLQTIAGEDGHTHHWNWMDDVDAYVQKKKKKKKVFFYGEKTQQGSNFRYTSSASCMRYREWEIVTDNEKKERVDSCFAVVWIHVTLALHSGHTVIMYKSNSLLRLFACSIVFLLLLSFRPLIVCEKERCRNFVHCCFVWKKEKEKEKPSIWAYFVFNYWNNFPCEHRQSPSF